MIRRALLPVAPALAAAYKITPADLLARPHDEASWLLGQLPAFVGRAVDRTAVTCALETLQRLSAD